MMWAKKKGTDAASSSSDGKDSKEGPEMTWKKKVDSSTLVRPVQPVPSPFGTDRVPPTTVQPPSSSGSSVASDGERRKDSPSVGDLPMTPPPPPAMELGGSVTPPPMEGSTPPGPPLPEEVPAPPEDTPLPPEAPTEFDSGVAPPPPPPEESTPTSPAPPTPEAAPVAPPEAPPVSPPANAAERPPSPPSVPTEVKGEGEEEVPSAPSPPAEPQEGSPEVVKEVEEKKEGGKEEGGEKEDVDPPAQPEPPAEEVEEEEKKSEKEAGEKEAEEVEEEAAEAEEEEKGEETPAPATPVQVQKVEKEKEKEKEKVVKEEENAEVEAEVAAKGTKPDTKEKEGPPDLEGAAKSSYHKDVNFYGIKLKSDSVYKNPTIAALLKNTGGGGKKPTDTHVTLRYVGRQDGASKASEEELKEMDELFDRLGDTVDLTLDTVTISKKAGQNVVISVTILDKKLAALCESNLPHITVCYQSQPKFSQDILSENRSAMRLLFKKPNFTDVELSAPKAVVWDLGSVTVQGKVRSWK